MADRPPRPPRRPVLDAARREDADSAHRDAVVAFFDPEGEYGWWGGVYDTSRPRGFFSHEMARRRERVLEVLRRHARLGPGARVLECGCGPGGQLGAVAATGAAAVGVDLNARLLAGARAAVPEGRFARADVEALPFRDGAFDAVLCVGVLSYLREDERAIGELARVVRPGGVVVVANPSRLLAAKLLDPYYWLVWLPSRAARVLARRAPAQRAAGPFRRELIRRYRWRALDGVYRRAGLEERETVSVSFGPFTLWRRELLPVRWSIAASDALAALDAHRPRARLGSLSNHWVTALTRGADAMPGVRGS